MTRSSLLGASRVCALLVASGGILFSQSNAVGNISGTVSGPDRKPVAGALVRVDTGRGVREARTDEKGRFLFLQLLPGSAKVSVTAQDLLPFRTAVSILANQGVTLNIPLTAPVGAVVEVYAVGSNSVVGVDAATAISGTNITAEQIETLPAIGGVYNAFLKTVPGTPSGGYNFHGSEDGANTYTVNGVESRSAKGGTQLLTLNRDLIEQFNVLSGGVSAKYGRYVGAAVATVTKSGTNEFSGSIRHDLTSDSWNALAREAPYTTVARVPRRVLDSQSYTFLGPIIKDKIFIAAGYQTTTPSKTTVVKGSVSSGLFAPYFFTSTSQSELKDIKVDWQINTDHRLTAGWNQYLATSSGPTNGRGLSTLATGAGASRSETGFKSLGYTGSLASNLMVDAILSETLTKRGGSGTGSTGGANVVTWKDTLGAGAGDLYDNGTVTDSKNQERIRTLGLNLTWFAGKHAVEGGIQYYSSRIESMGSYDANYKSVTPSRALIEFSGWDANPPSMDRQYRRMNIGSPATTRLTVFNPLSGVFDSRVWGLFVNDVWTLDSHWSFNLGARFDSNHFKASPEGDEYTVSTAVPRLSASYDLFGNQKHVITLGLAEYAGQISASTFTGISASNVSSSSYYAYYGAGHGNDALNTDGSINWNVWGNSATALGQANPVAASTSVRSGAVESNIKPPRSREASLSYRYIDPKQSVTATLLHKVQDNYVGLKRIGSPGLGVDRATKVYYNDDGMESRYESLEIQYRRQIIEDLSVGGNLTWSYTRANAGQNVGYGSRNQYGDFIPNDLIAPFGPQSGQWSSSSTPFTAHIDSSYKHSFGRLGTVTATLLGNYWSKSFRGYRSYTGATSAEVQSYGYAGTVTRVYGEAETWWPEQYSFDLHFGYEIGIYRKVKAFAALDVTNLFNHMMPMYLNYSTALIDSSTGVTYTPGANNLPTDWYNNPNLKPVGYNAPNPTNNPYIMSDGQVGAYTNPRYIQVRVGFRF